jgi:hypothetical protein
MDLVSTQSTERGIALETAAELVEDRSGEGDFGGAVEVHDGLEGTTSGLGSCLFAEDELVERGYDVLEADYVDVLLRHLLVGGLFVLVDALGKVEARAERLAYEIDNGTGHGGGEHEVLALDLLRVWQVLPDLVDFPLEALVEQAVGLVHDQGVEVRALDARVWVGENVEEATRRTNEKMAAFAQGFLKHGSLHGSADSCLDDKAGSSCDLLCFDSNLLRQLSGR